MLLLPILIYGCATGTGDFLQIPEEIADEPEVYFCPGDDCSDVMAKHILSARSSVDCAFYDLGLENIIDALETLQSTADVRLVMEKSNFNNQIKLDRIKLDTSSQLMHNKFCVIDSKNIITGSFNPTINGNNFNDNNMIIFYSEYLAKNFNDEFDELWNGNFGRGKPVNNPKMIINEMEIENYFCPEDCGIALEQVLNLIKSSEHSVKVLSFAFTREDIADELIKAGIRGVNVSVVIENRMRNTLSSEYQRIKDFGIDIRLDGNKYTMHHKMIIIDGKIVITGSPNLSKNGFENNDENMLIIHDKKLALKYANEFDRLFNQAS